MYIILNKLLLNFSVIFNIASCSTPSDVVTRLSIKKYLIKKKPTPGHLVTGGFGGGGREKICNLSRNLKADWFIKITQRDNSDKSYDRDTKNKTKSLQ